MGAVFFIVAMGNSLTIHPWDIPLNTAFKNKSFSG
jgi:hypothetical protein